MRLVQKDAIARFSNQAYDMKSFMTLMGEQPAHIPLYIKYKKQMNLGLLAITETVGNIYEKDFDGSGKLNDIETISFTWKVDVSQIPLLYFTRACSDTGANGIPFSIYLNDRYFAKYDVIALQNTQQLYVIEEPERISATEFRYTVRLVTGNPNTQVDTRYMQFNSTARYVYNMHPEWSEGGGIKTWYNLETHINHLTKIRAEQRQSSDFAASKDMYFMSEADFKKAKEGKGNYRVFRMTTVEQAVMDHWLQSANAALLFGRSTINESNGKPYIQLDNLQDVVSGDGIIAQYERYAHTIGYNGNNLNVKHFQDAIEHVVERRGQSVGNHITVLCNRIMHRQAQRALKNEIFTANPQGMWFYTKEKLNTTDKITKHRVSEASKVAIPNEIAVGATFSTFIYAGNTITFLVDEALTNYYNDKGYGIFIDTGYYDTDQGAVPAVHLKTLKGRSLVKNWITGIGGINGSTSGTVSNNVDGSSFVAVGWRGAAVMNPYAATILTEIK